MLASNEIVDVFVDLQPTLKRIVTYRTGSQQAAQDLTQDMYFRILQLANTFPTYDDARNYLIRIAMNSSIDYLRTEKRRAQLLSGAVELFEGYNPSPEENLFYKQKLLSIDKALEDMPPKCREVLYLSRIEGLTHAEIASRMNVSRSLVEKYSVKALLHCKNYLNSQD